MDTQRLYSGIDLHKRSAMITTIDQDGHIVKQANLKTERDALAFYFRSQSGEHRAVVEATTGWYWVHDLLEKEGIHLTLAHAKYLKAISYAKVKTDKADALTLAQLLRTDMIPAAHQISHAHRDERDLVRTRLRLVSRRTACLNALHRLLEKFNCASIEELPPLYRLQARCQMAQIELLRRQIKRLERALHPMLLSNEDVERLLGLPGVGNLSALTILLETDQIERFHSVKHFLSYCRLVPGAANSGGKMRHRSGSKDGNRFLKIAFSHVAVRALQYYPEIKRFYQLKRRKKPEAVARTLVAKEIARIAYYVLKHKTDFNGRFRGELLSRVKAQPWPRLAARRITEPAPAGSDL